MYITKLIIHNFKGFKHFAMDFSDKQIGYVIWGYMAFSAIPILPTYYQSRFGSRDKKR